MRGMKTVGSLLARFILCCALIACLWIVSISYRIGRFDYRDHIIFASDAGGLTYSDRLLLIASLALLVGLLCLYRAGRVSAVLMVLASLIAITTIDHPWAVYRDFDEYKGVPSYVFQPAVASVLIAPFPFLFPARRAANAKSLAVCWAVLILTMVLLGSQSIGSNILHLWGMIGPSYMENVILCLLAVEAARQARRVYLALRIHGPPEPPPLNRCEPGPP
jgi:hypothetical protein